MPQIITKALEPEQPKPKAGPTWVRPRYSHYDHLCVTYDLGNMSGALNQAGDNGWELMTLSKLDREQLMCFRRPSAVATRLR
ncbi:MAG: hypothetical protein A2289_13210 [Deltaproteobacteria bacterium RIFOXYA12_FULL_58_15]|nr:MAG: hypothetical protein A2289_13210 [Deltaproteobacteria bacterium RIFOXYA12_FULL_58_15]OGR13812.1 MAG: hypothetical protein A2341_01315 [Deltaproteobacteria bacterium RIFOXYB12_FULL_58_9]